MTEKEGMIKLMCDLLRRKGCSGVEVENVDVVEMLL